jgi:hypothetical protein
MDRGVPATHGCLLFSSENEFLFSSGRSLTKEVDFLGRELVINLAGPPVHLLVYIF